MNRDEIKGRGEQLKGSAKRKMGDLTDDERLRSEGEGDRMRGQVREGFGRGKRKIGEAMEDVGERMKK